MKKETKKTPSYAKASENKKEKKVANKKKAQKKAMISRKKHEIDATDRAVGRIATQVAMLLRGKNKADFTPHIDAGDFVVITNAKKVKFTGKKLVQKDYFHHTMYPGGLRRTPMKKVFEKDPTEVIRRAVYGMLPKNRLRNEMMKRLTIKA